MRRGCTLNDIGGVASRSNANAVPRHGERLRDEDQHVRGDRRDGQSHGYHRRSRERTDQRMRKRHFAGQSSRSEQRRRFHMGLQDAGISVEFLLLRLRDHADTVRYTRETLRIEILSRHRDADQLGVWIAGARVRARRLLLSHGHTIRPRIGRGAQFGTVISMPLSGILSEYGFDGGWPSIFYVFGAVGTVWCIAFLIFIYEDPETHPRIAEDEKKYILSALWGNAGVSSPPVPWVSIVTSLPFWAILIAHMGQNYGYETLMTELPTFMKQILHFDIKSNGTVSALPYLAMWIFSMVISHVADWMISSGKFNHTITRKIINSIGQFGPAIALVAASFTGCNSWLTVAILTVGVGLNGGIYSGFKVNHLDISPRFAGVLMSFTNCLANLAGLLAPIVAGYIISGTPSQAKWRLVFVISAGVYVVCTIFYVIFGSGQRQSWDNPEKDEEKQEKQALDSVKTIAETRH
nr:PREDICTED: putative inorganic phosphate cotransporter isoform X4 [Megachile rotundata]